MPIVSRATSGVLLLLVFVLLIFVLGAVQSGPIAGAQYQLPGFLAFDSPPPRYQTSSDRTVTTSQVTATRGQTTQVASTDINGSTPGPVIPLSARLGLLEDLAWYVPIAVVLGVGVGLLVMLARSRPPTVFDLKGMVSELENERSHFVGSWSKKLRNAALLRYYLLMAEVCTKVGITDGPAETPNAFIGRASAELELAGPDSERFADVVDRAHYGLELTGDEVVEASRFMDSFTGTIAKRISLG